MKYASSIIPLLYFVKEYFKIENTHLLKKTKWIYSFLISVVFFYAINADNTDVCRNFTFLTSENPYLQDCLIAITVLIGTFQILFILTGFFYITHKLNNISSLRKPIEEQFIGKNFFKWGFIISFSIFIFTLLNLGSSIFKISIYHSTEFDLIEILGLLANYFLLLYSGRFLGNLIQFRGYSLKKYFGIINVFTLAPILNIIPFLVLLLSKKRNDVREYLQKLNKNKNIHLLIYCVLIAAFLIYDYWSEEGKDPKVLIKIPVFIIAILLVTRFKIMTKIVPFVVVLYLYFEDVKAFFEITEDYLTFFKERIFSFLWLSSFAVFVVYYVIYYVLHKCFYVDYSQEKNLEKRIEDSTKFNEPKIN
jgi:uncharacterized membrane protein YciS (DUF1049 family)